MNEGFSIDGRELRLQNEMLTWKNEPVGAIDGVDVHRRIAADSLLRTKPPPRQLSSAHCSFAYSALACLRMGMSGSASFHSERKSL